MKKSAIVTGVAASMLAFGAFAADDMKGMKFESLDKNSDGRITASEASAHQGLSTGFATADANADGGLTKSEFNSWHSSMKGSGDSMGSGSERTPSGASGSMGRDSGSTTTPGTQSSSSSSSNSDTVPSDDTTTQPTP